MFKTKQQVDQHVRTMQSHLKSERERNLRGLNFSQLYFKIGEYELSRRYVSKYMSVNDKSAVAFKQLGLSLEALGEKQKAFSAYRTSLDLEPKQPELLLKMCEILLQGDVVLDPHRCKYWCDLAEEQNPSNNTVFQLKEKIMEAQDSNPMEIKELILKEIEDKPTDPFLRIRLLQHLLQQNLIIDAFQYAQDVELKNLNMFKDNVKWYETLTDILQKYKLDLDQSKKTNWEYWLFNITVLEKQVCLSLSEMHNYRKSLVDCANAIVGLDQALNEASKLVISLCKERELSSQFLLHFQGQLCLHMATFLFKKAKKDHNIWKETIKHCAPLLLLAFHLSPPDLHDNWLNHTTENNRQIVQKWNREGSYRCSQAGHTILSCVTEKRVMFMDRISNYCSGSWREKLYKAAFSKLDHVSKMNTSIFINSNTLKEPTLTLPGLSELKVYDVVSQRQYPSSLHHFVWLGLSSKNLWELKCNIFEGLEFSRNNLVNCNADSLNQLDIDTFLYCAVLCAQTLQEESVNSGYVSTDKPALLPANIMEQLCSAQQLKWWSAAYKLCNSDTQSELGDLRLIITRGIEIVRCIGQHGLSAKLLCILANIFNERAKLCEIKSEKHFLEARVSLFYTTAYPLLQRLKSHQTICPLANRMFNFHHKELKMSEISQLIEELKMFQGIQLMNDGDNEKALETFQGIKNPYASFHQGVIYKKLAADQMSSSKENLTSEMRSKHIIMLSKARDCFHLTLDRLRDGKTVKHPLDQILASHMEEVEEQLSRIDPDTCLNRNDCEILSEDNISSAGSLGEHIQLNLSSNYINNSYNHANLNSTPKHKARHNTSQNFRSTIAANYEVRRTESRPSPERLDAQIRSLSLKREHDMTSLMDTIQVLVDEIKDLKCTSSQESKNQKKMIEELKTEVTDLKKILGKTKSANTPNLDDQDFGYLLEEELQNQEYSLPNLYPNYQSRVPQNTSMGYPGNVYQNPVYPMYSPYASLGGAVPFVEGQQMQDYRNQMLNQQLIYNQSMLNKLNPQESIAMLQAMNSVYPQNPRPSDMGNMMPNKSSEINLLNQQSSLPIQSQAQMTHPVNQNTCLIGPSLITSQSSSNNGVPQLSSTISKPQTIKPAPVNVVITNSDPLPSHTVSTSQPTLSVTIPAHHIKTSTPQPMQPKGIHNYQIPMPATTTLPTGQSIFGMPETSLFDQKSNKLPETTKPLFGISAPTENIFSSPKMQPFTNMTNDASLLSIGTPNSLASKMSDNFQTPKNISLRSNTSIYTTPNSISMNQTDASVSTLNTVRLNRSSDSQCSNTSVSERYDPLPDYKPIIPLPDVVELKTGEEDEEVLFKSRAKLYRFINKEWKERGIGELKLLKNNSNKKVRVLMRRDHTHKICANHIITPEMQLSLLKNETKAYIWYAPDFADENVIHEKLCARFKTEELGKSFYDTFEKSRLEAESIKIDTSSASVTSTDKGFGDKFKLKDGAWNCSSCYTTNASNRTSCVACSAHKVALGSGDATVEASIEKINVGGFTFSSTPVFTLKETNTKNAIVESAPTDTQKSSPFTSFSFCKPDVKTGNQIVNPFSSNKLSEEKITSSNKALSNPEVVQNKSTPFKMPVLNTSIETGSKNVNTSLEEVEEFVPTAEFVPVIPLPEVVNEKTGEENENVLFEERAKLLRYDIDSKEWKERGLGNIKVLVDKNDNQKVRLLMRREIILKVCCNHYITKDIQFTKKPSEKMNSLTWTAQDYAENEMKIEVFAIKFKTKEICDKFYNTVVDAQSKLKDKKDELQNQKSLETNMETPKQSASSKPLSQQGFGDKFKPKSGSWSCKACYISNESDKDYCVACETPKNDTIPKKEKNIFGDSTTVSSSPFMFGMPNATTQSPITTATPVLAFGTKPVQASAGFTFGIPKPAASVSFGTSSSAFNFSSPTSNSSAGFTFGVPNTTPVSTSKSDEGIKPESSFVSSGTGKFEFVFTPKSPKAKSPLKNTSRTENESDGEEEYASDGEEDNIYFTPVIPLPEKIVVTTGEENEEVLYCHRAKLFRFCNHEWKERGLGDIKILRNSDTKKIRVLMRRSQILKICLNHILTPDIEYLPKDEKTWLFTANDFSEEEFALQQFCIRFKTEEIAKEFKNAIDSAQASLSSGAVSNTHDGNDSDIEITFETKVTEEEKNLARKYFLPDNFYAYKYREACKGCIGCNPDEFVFPGQKTNEVSSTAASSTFSFIKAQTELKTNIENTTEQPSIFGGKSFSQFNVSFGEQKNVTEKSPLIFGKSIFGQAPANTDASNTEIKSDNSILKPPLMNSGEVPPKPIFGGNIFSAGGIVSKSVVQDKPSNILSDAKIDSTTMPIQLNVQAKSSHIFGQNVFGVNAENNTKPTVSTSNIFTAAALNKKVENVTTAQNIFGSSITIAPVTTQSNTPKTFGEVATSHSGFSLKSSSITVAPQAEIKEDVPMFKTDSCLSFANIASGNASDANVFAKATSTASVDKTFSWAGAGAPVFGSKNTPKKSSLNSTSQQNESNADQDEDNDDDNGTVPDEEYDPHYDPIIEMPDTIVVTTGEEDETKLFCERAKLFRYDSTTKEWKERGVGEIKLLHHPVRNSYRLLLRREQVHKLVLNQLLDNTFVLNQMNLSDRAWCWAGINHAEQPGKGEELAVRFKNPELANDFKNAVESVVQKISENEYVVQSYSDEDDDDDNVEYHEDYEDDEDDERSVMFDKRATLMIRTSVGTFTELAMGDLQILYDSDLFGARIMMFANDGNCVSNTIIAVNTTMSISEANCTWSGIDYAVEEPQMRTLKARFGSVDAAVEFLNTFKEGVSFAREADIMDPIPDVFTPEDD